VIVALDDYKDVLEIDKSNNSFDSILNDMADEVESKIEEFLGRSLEQAEYTDELYDGSGSSMLILKQFPITTVASIKQYDGYSGGEVWTTLVLGTDYERLLYVKESTAVYMDGMAFAKGVQNYKITYTAGYQNVPLEIVQACKKLMLLYYGETRKTKTLDKASVSITMGTTTTTTYDKEAEKRILDSIKKYMAFNI